MNHWQRAEISRQGAENRTPLEPPATYVHIFIYDLLLDNQIYSIHGRTEAEPPALEKDKTAYF